MASVLTTIEASADETVAAGVSGKIIRIHRIITSSSAEIIAKSGETAVLPTLACGANANVFIDFGSQPVALAREEALVVNNADSSEVTVYMEYDVVE